MAEFDYEYIRDLFLPLGDVTFKKMFGGLAIYHKGLIIAIIFEDGLRLKGDDQTESLFAKEACFPVTYIHKNTLRETKMPYFSVPEACYDDPDTMKIWAIRAFEASQRADAKKTKRKH